MGSSNRLLAERAFHDRQAAGRASRFGGPDAFHFNDDWYLDHESWIRPAFAQLGDVAAKDVLDLGCGHGMAAVVLARRGARVTALDLSAGYLEEARLRAVANDCAIRVVQADGERLPFADASFDRIWGSAILHHLDLTIAAPGLRRVLRPGGAAVFCEPWGGNPLLAFARRWLPYPGKERTADERPLGPDDLRPMRGSFPGLTVQGFQLLSMLSRVAPKNRFVDILRHADATILGRLPSLGRFCRYIVLTAVR